MNLRGVQKWACSAVAARGAAGGGSQAVTLGVAPSCPQLSLLKARAGLGPGREYLKATSTLRARSRVLEIQRVLGGVGCDVLPCRILPFLACLAQERQKGHPGQSLGDSRGASTPILFPCSSTPPTHPTTGDPSPLLWWCEGRRGAGVQLSQGVAAGLRAALYLHPH